MSCWRFAVIRALRIRLLNARDDTTSNLEVGRLAILGDELSVAALLTREDRRVAYGHGV